MTSIDLVTVLGNLSQSLHPVQRMVTGLAYILGIFMFIVGLAKLKNIADAQANSSSHERMFVPMVCFLVGTGLVYLPSMLDMLDKTVFGSNSVLAYIPESPFDFYGAMVLLIQTVGVVWFVRGCVLIVNASEPGKQQGLKGFVYLSAGILSINFYATVGTLDASITALITTASEIKKAAGY